MAAVRDDGDRALLIGSPDRSMLDAEPLQCIGRGMAVPVVAPHRQDRDGGRQFPEPVRPARRAAAVMPHLEQVHVTHTTPQRRLRRRAGIAHEDGAKAAVAHQQHHGIVVEVDPPAAPRRIGMQDREPDTVHDELLAPSRRVPGRARPAHDPKHLAIGRVGSRRRGFDHRAHRHRSQYRAEPAHVIEVRMRRRPARRWLRRLRAAAAEPPGSHRRRSGHPGARHRSRRNGRSVYAVPRHRPGPRPQNATSVGPRQTAATRGRAQRDPHPRHPGQQQPA